MAEPVHYNLELLTSFDARTNSGGLMTTDEGLRRFQQQTRDGAIGTAARVKLHLEPSSAVITDSLSGEEMEHIPVGLIYQPVAAVGDRGLGRYDNVLVFTVLEDAFQMAPPEMYFFQCLDCRAQEVVSALQTAKGGGLVHRKSNAAYSRAPAARNNRMEEFNNQAERTAKAASTYMPGPAAGEMFRQSVNNGGSANEKTSQNIKLLDHCLDDIEKFVQRLQQAAEAYSKLEERRRDRQGGADVVGPGDGMLIMRARPPPAQDYISIFQKFKLAINLLSSLKGHIHNPNAPEMIHFLFKPLGLVVDSIRDPMSGVPALAHKVVSPLLTAESIQLLSDCLTTRESQLWSSLGEAWTRSRDQWPGSIPVYVPVFADGWSPPAYWMDENLPASFEHGQPLHRTNLQADDVALSRVDRKPSSSMPDSRQLDSERLEPKRSLAMYPISEITGVVDEKQQKYVWELLARDARICLLLDNYAANNPKELTVRRGEVVEVLDDRRNWWSVRNSLGQSGFVPNTLLKPYSRSQEPTPSSSWDNSARNGMSSPAEQRAAYGSSESRPSAAATPPPLARQEQPPVVMRASVAAAAVAVDRRSNSNAYASDPPIASPRLSSHSDPRNSYENPPVVAPRSRGADEHRSSYVEGRPSVIAAPAFGYQDPPLAQRKSVVNDVDQIYDDTFDDSARMNYAHQRTAVDDLNDEFRRKLSGAEAIRPRAKAQQVAYIYQDSTTEEIQYWLQVKGFSYNVQQQLYGFDGKKLFSIPKAKLEMMFGDEGTRLNSQILVQRNLSGFKTARSAELQQILKNRKLKSDADESAYASENF